MNVNTIILPMIAAIMVGGLGTAHAENFTVEMTENGFSTNELSLQAGDTVTFINTHYVTDINVEPHAISDFFAVPYTENSYYILDDSTLEHTFSFSSCSPNTDYVFHDRFFTVYPLFIICGAEVVTIVEETVESEPVVEEPVIIEEEVVITPTTNITSDETEQELTAELTASLEREGVLKNKVNSLEDKVAVLEHSIVALNGNVDSLKSDKLSLESEKVLIQGQLATVTEERDYFEEQWVNWKAVAMEQLRVMINVLGIGN